MFKELSIKKKLYLGFGSIVAIILVLLALALINFGRASDARDVDRRTLEVLIETDRITTAVLQIQSSTRGFLLSGDESLLELVKAEETAAHAHVDSVLKLNSHNPSQQARLKKLKATMDNWINNVIHPVIEKRRELTRQGRVPEQATSAAGVRTGTATVAEIRKLIDDSSDEEEKLLAESTKKSDELDQAMMLLLTLGGLLCVVLAGAIAYLLGKAILTPLNHVTQAVGLLALGQQGARAEVVSNDELGQVAFEFNRMAQSIEDSVASELAATNLLKAKVDSLLETVSRAASGDLTGTVSVSGVDAIGRLGTGLDTMFANLRMLLNNVQKAGIQVTASATEIAASAKQQEATGIEQAQTSIEILSTTKEISANTSQLLRTMEEATAVADYTTHATADAQNNLKRMNVTMQQMVAATDSINAKLAALSEKASNINSVLITITKVADQTNILSLNAAIEAEKAGDAGRGFSVVATEIRRLADQTSVSTWDIEQMLKEMQSAVSASVMGMDKFSEEIRRSVGEVSQVAGQLSSVMDQVQKLAPQFDLVLQGMQSQAVGASQISETMMQLNDATQQTVESLKATSEAVHQLQYAASDLQSSVTTFAVAT
jgi:methyl-accepting chemotaxis protein WspA